MKKGAKRQISSLDVDNIAPPKSQKESAEENIAVAPTTCVGKIERIRDQLMQKTLLQVSGGGKTRSYRLCEIEFYVHSIAHQDSYVHCSPDQLITSCFYFHKHKNGTFKSGTYKGLDVTFGSIGNGSDEGKEYFGVLIRSVQNMESGEFIEGPCRTVNDILEFLGHHDVQALSGHIDLAKDAFDSSSAMCLLAADLPLEPMFAGPRIGLSAKYPEFRDKPYRICTMLDKIKKERKNMVAI